MVIVWTPIGPCRRYSCLSYGSVAVAKPLPHDEVPMSTAVLEPPPTEGKPLTTGRQPAGILVALWAFVTIPFLALLAAVPVMWGWGLNWVDVALFVVFYSIGAAGIGTGFHRYFTHGS